MRDPLEQSGNGLREGPRREDPGDPAGNGRRSRGEQRRPNELLPSAVDGTDFPGDRKARTGGPLELTPTS